VRLTQYAAVLQPPDLIASADPATAAGAYALNFAVKMLAAQIMTPGEELIEHLVAAGEDITIAAGHLAECFQQATVSQAPQDPAPDGAP
jgi:hypothetical protein